MAGVLIPTGLVYASLYPLLDRIAQDDAQQWHDLLSDVRVMEAQALRTLAQHRRNS